MLRSGMRASPPGPDEKEPLAGADAASPSAKDGEVSEDKLGQQKSDASAPESPLSWQQRAKTFAIEYGRVGVCTHIVLSLASFSIIYAGVSSGLDVTAILEFVGYTSSASEAATNSAGSMLIAYTVYKMLSPVRWPITFAVTPVVLRALRRRGYMLPVASKSSSKPPPPSGSGHSDSNT